MFVKISKIVALVFVRTSLQKLSNNTMIKDKRFLVK